MCFLVVGISDVSDSDKNFEWILFVGFSYASFYVALDFSFSFFTMPDLARQLGDHRTWSTTGFL